MARIANLSSSNQRSDKQRGPLPTLGEIVERLTRVGETEHWITSCYLKLEPRDRTRRKYQIKLKNRIKERMAWLEDRGISRNEREAIAADLERVRAHLEDPSNLPAGRGVAIFACGPMDLFEAIPLPVVLRSRLAVDRSPLVRELAALDNEFGLVYCTVYDRASARFFRLSAFGIEELPGLPVPEATRPARFHGARAQKGPGVTVQGVGEHNFHQRMREEKDKHHAAVAQRLFDLTRQGATRGVVVASTGGSANSVVTHLHPYVRDALLGTANLNPKTASAPEVIDAVLEVRRQSEREWERAHVADLLEGLGTGWGVNGIEETLRCLARGQVRTLLVDAAAHDSGVRCGESGRLTIVADGCAGEGDAQAVPDVIDEAIEDALRQGSHVDVVEDSDTRGKIDGLAALLRFVGH